MTKSNKIVGIFFILIGLYQVILGVGGLFNPDPLAPLSVVVNLGFGGWALFLAYGIMNGDQSTKKMGMIYIGINLLLVGYSFYDLDGKSKELNTAIGQFDVADYDQQRTERIKGEANIPDDFKKQIEDRDSKDGQEILDQMKDNLNKLNQRTPFLYIQLIVNFVMIVLLVTF